MSFSKTVWNHTLPVYQAIIDHPFNQELMKGILERQKFNIYIEQDSLYLQDFSRCLALIASRIPLSYIRPFLRFSEMALIAEQEVVHQFFKDQDGYEEMGVLTSATLSYTSYLLKTCSLDRYEVAVAAVLPCFWIYREVGRHIAENTVYQNPYARWIETYASEDFSKGVDEAIRIFDALAAQASEEIQEKMKEAFYKSSVLEWHFWNDAYGMRGFDSLR